MERSRALKRNRHEHVANPVRQTRDSIADIWGPRTPYHGEGNWPVRVDQRLELPEGVEPDRWVQSACLLCSNGCACDIAVKDGRIVGVRGRAVDRVNRGRLGPKGLHGWIANHSPDRLTQPMIRREDGKLHAAGWDEAMGLIVQKSREILQKYTPTAIGFYNTGQLFNEEYYTLSLIAHGGLGTLTMDGNTRLCTATAAQALKETFGSDGQPSSYADIDVTDCLLMVGHNMSSTQTVLWARVLDRLRGPNPPKLVVIDPRRTATAREATVHLAPRVGTNVALLNGLLNLIIENGHTDQEFIQKRTVGFEKLRKIVAEYPPERVEKITGVPAAKLREAATVLGTARSLLSTVLQGVYQSNQATAAAVQVNNLNLIRGMIGRPGSGVMQMNGQPTAQNTRETGCDGEFPVFLNYENEEHMKLLARHWNVDPLKIPHWTNPHHAMEIFRMAETGAVRMLWVVCTNPAVSLPELHRIRKILKQRRLFLVVQDAFMTETAAYADVVLPAAIWGEKTGTFTNADRTVHISHKAIEPPGEARSDFEIFVDYAKKMDFRDKDGLPLLKWSDPEGAFDHWRELTRGRLCDYSGMSYSKLSEGSGIRWPCNERNPEGTERLYTDHVFPTAGDVCQEYGHDLNLGGSIPAMEYRSHDPQGKARIKGAHYQPFIEEPDESYPYRLTTGRVVYQFHTRTKTGRAHELNEASPDAYAQISSEDASRLGAQEGDWLVVSTRRGSIEVKAKVGDIEPGQVFIPFHFGYWDEVEQRHRAANELTITAWDPVSKQPIFKQGAAQVYRREDAPKSSKVTTLTGILKDRAKEAADKLMSSAHVERPRISDYLGLLTESNRQLALACRQVAARHFEEKTMQGCLHTIAEYSEGFVEKLKPWLERHGRHEAVEPAKLRQSLFPAVRAGSYGLLRDLHDLFLMWSEAHVCLTIIGQVAQELRDRELFQTIEEFDERSKEQKHWLLTQIKHRAPHTLVVPQ